MNDKYVAVYSFGGIITDVRPGNDLKQMIKTMKITCKINKFDYTSDDARIFSLGHPFQEVHSYDHTELEEE